VTAAALVTALAADPTASGVSADVASTDHAVAITAWRERIAKPPAALVGRDLRLDLFRGLALWFIFLDQIPNNIVSLITVRNYGFSDAREIFIFISGYTAAFVYGRVMRNRGFVLASASILRRSGQILPRISASLLLHPNRGLRLLLIFFHIL